MLVTLEELKQHLMIEDDADDAYLLSLIYVAEDAVFKNLNIKDVDGLEEVPPTIIQSILVLAATLYNNRESVSYASVTEVPHTFDYLIGLNKNYDDTTGRI